MTIDETIKRYINNAEYERTHGNLQGCLEFRQLAEWLKDYKRLLEQEPCDDAISRILKRMWNCRGKHTISIDKVKMEQIIRDELSSVTTESKIGRYDSDKWSEPCEDANANQHNSNALNDVGQHTNALEGDAISRQALLDAFGFSEKTRKWGGDHSGYNTMMLYEIQDVIESAPSVIPQEPKKEKYDNRWFNGYAN